MLRGEVQQVLSDNGVVRNFFLMAVAEDQHGGRRGCSGLFIVCLLGVVGIGTARLMFITVGFRFVLHARFCQLLFVPLLGDGALAVVVDRKSTRLNSSHSSISYAVFCLKKKKK